MCILCVASRWSRRIVTMLPCLVIPLIILWALSQVLPPGFRFEVTSPRLACVFVLLISLGWYEVVMPRLSSWRARRTALLRDRRRVQAQEAAKWRKEATRRCRNCLTAYREQTPAGGRFMCTYCGHVSRRPVLDIPGITSGIPSNGVLLQGGIAQIGIPVPGICGRKNVRAWNGKGWPVKASWSRGKSWTGDRSRPSEWSGADAWLGGSFPGVSNYWGSNANMCGDVIGGGEKCSAGESYPGVIFLLRIIGLFHLCIRWVWRRIFRRGTSAEDEALNAIRKAGLRKGEDGCNSQGNKGERARRKAEEKRQARLEKQRREEEERKQREEVARLVEERRRLRVEKLNEEKDNERETAAEREREIRREREAERRRQDKLKQKEKGLGRDKTEADAEEVKNGGKENEKKGDVDKKGENEKREVPKATTRHATEVRRSARNFRVFRVETGLKNNDHGIKVGNNGTSKVGGTRYLGHIKGSFHSYPKSSAWHPSNVTSFLGRSFRTDSNPGVKFGKSTSSGDALLRSIGSSPVGSNNLKSTPSTGSAWNRMAWTKAWGKESTVNSVDILSQEAISTHIKEDQNSGGFEAEKTAGNGADKSLATENLQRSVEFELQPLSPVTTHTESLGHHMTSPLTFSLTSASADLGSPLEQQCQTESGTNPEATMCSFPSHICFGASPWLEPIHRFSNLVTGSGPPANSMSSYDNISPCSMLPDNLVLSKVDSFEDLLNAPNTESFVGPISESCGILPLDLENSGSSDERTSDILSSGCEPALAPVHRPGPIESPISKLLPSDIVDEVRVSGEQCHPITEPWSLQSLSVDGPNDVSEQGKWQMWGTPQLGQTKLATQGDPSPWLLPIGNGLLGQEKGLFQPLSQRNGELSFEPESHLPSCLFTPQKNTNNSNQSNADITGVAALSRSNSLWVNEPAFESVGQTWDNLSHRRMPPSFVNCSTQGDVHFSVITTDSHLYEPPPTSIWFKAGMENSKDKSNWCAETELGSPSWSTRIKTSARPHIGGIYITPDVQSVWSYK